MIDPTVAPPLVNVDDLEEFPGAPFDETSVQIAGAVVRGVCGWHIAPSVTVDLVLDSDGGRVLLLPSLHLTEVAAVRDRDANPIEGWRTSTAGMLEHPGGWPCGLSAVTVTVTHGLPVVPPDLLGVVADIARYRAALNARPPGLRSKTVGKVTYDYIDPNAGVGGKVDPIAAYRHILDRYAL